MFFPPKGAVFHPSDEELVPSPQRAKTARREPQVAGIPGVASPLFLSTPIVRWSRVIFGNHQRRGQRPSDRGTYGDGFPGPEGGSGTPSCGSRSSCVGCGPSGRLVRATISLCSTPQPTQPLPWRTIHLLRRLTALPQRSAVFFCSGAYKRPTGL
jgi:hypothetical protein